MKGACRQVPLCPSDVRYCITAVMNPELGQPSLHELRAQPFGAGHAVPNFCRVAEWLARLCQLPYHLFVDHFFDDFFLIDEPAETANIGMFILKETFAVLGFSLDPEKSQPPAQLQAVLGVMFSTASLTSRRVISVSPKPTKLAGLQKLIQAVLVPSGKLGREIWVLVFDAFWESWPLHRLGRSLLLQWLHCWFTRTHPMYRRGPLASYWEEIATTHWTLPWSFHLAKSQIQLVQKWASRQNYMGQLELLAAPFALATWSTKAQQRPILFFLDNDSASSNLIKGYSPKVDSSVIVGEFWLMAASLKSSIYIDRVESKSNLADGPSRLNFRSIISNGGTLERA